MTLQVIQSRRERHQRRDEQRNEPMVISGEKLRQMLGLSSSRFYALKKSGRLRHLVAVNLSTRGRTFYVRDAAIRWATEQETLTLRAPRSHASR